MVKSGMIYLFARDGSLSDGKHYHDEPERKRIIQTWAKMYRAKFFESYLQIAPNTNPSKVAADGMNDSMKVRKRKGGLYANTKNKLHCNPNDIDVGMSRLQYYLKVPK